MLLIVPDDGVWLPIVVDFYLYMNISVHIIWLPLVLLYSWLIPVQHYKWKEIISATRKRKQVSQLHSEGRRKLNCNGLLNATYSCLQAVWTGRNRGCGFMRRVFILSSLPLKSIQCWMAVKGWSFFSYAPCSMPSHAGVSKN